MNYVPFVNLPNTTLPSTEDEEAGESGEDGYDDDYDDEEEGKGEDTDRLGQTDTDSWQPAADADEDDYGDDEEDDDTQPITWAQHRRSAQPRSITGRHVSPASNKRARQSSSTAAASSATVTSIPDVAANQRRHASNRKVVASAFGKRFCDCHLYNTHIRPSLGNYRGKPCNQGCPPNRHRLPDTDKHGNPVPDIAAWARKHLDTTTVMRAPTP